MTTSTATSADGEAATPPTTLPMTGGSITLVPTACFFVESVEPPIGLKGSALEAELQAWVEDFSPFPIEHTAWGYLQPKRAPWILLYAAYRPHTGIPREASADVEHLWLPAFTCLYGARSAQQPTWYFLVESECLSALRFPAHSPCPDRVTARFGENLLEQPDKAWQLRKEILATAAPKPDGDVVDAGMFRCAATTLERGGNRVSFELEYQQAQGQPWKSAGRRRLGGLKKLLAADLRDSVSMTDERRRQRFDATAWRLMQGLAAAVVIMFCLQLWLFSRSRELTTLEQRVETRAAPVSEVQQRETSVKAMRALLRPQASPFDWTLLLNSVRPESISFQTVSFDDKREASIYGQSADIPSVNAYVEALRGTEQFHTLELAEINTTSEGVRFNLRGTLASALPDLPAPAAENTEVAGDTAAGEPAPVDVRDEETVP